MIEKMNERTISLGARPVELLNKTLELFESLIRQGYTLDNETSGKFPQIFNGNSRAAFSVKLLEEPLETEITKDEEVFIVKKPRKKQKKIETENKEEE